MQIVKNRMKFFVVSIILILFGISMGVYNKINGHSFFNYDVEFSGGTSIQIDIGKEFNNTDIEKLVADTTKQSAPQIQKIIGTNQVSIKIKSIDKQTRDKLIDSLIQKYNFNRNSVMISDVSPTISSEMQRTALLSVAMACVAILLYVSIRFKNIKTGASAIVGLLHDAFITVLVYAVFRIPLNYSFIAVILTILGYSINSTIVIFDRIRENARQRMNTITLVDESIKQTMRRSIFTSCTTLLSIICLYIIGVPSIKDFALPIIIGIICGTYASVCIAPNVWFMMQQRD